VSPRRPVDHRRDDAEERLYSAINSEEFTKDIRKLQARTKCTNKTCVDFIRLFGKYVGEDKVAKGFHTCDKKLKEAAGVNVLQLHGCTTCNRHVFLPSSKATHCPHCGGARYDAQGKPNEVCQIYLYLVIVFLLTATNIGTLFTVCSASFTSL
jgi:hypothetical protein